MGNDASDTTTITFTFAAETGDSRTWEIKATQVQGYIVRFGQCSVFLIPINKRHTLEITVMLSFTDGGAVL
jgi:hypothetical protein